MTYTISKKDQKLERKLYGSTSENENNEELTGVQYLRSVNINDQDAIVELVTCSIHLAILEKPRKLQCQHAFCTDCLIKLSKINEEIFCPICRAKIKCNDPTKLPEALLEKQLIELIMQKRIAECSKEPMKGVILSETEKEELIKHLLKEQNETYSEMSRLNRNTENTSVKQNNEKITIASPVSSICSSTYDIMDIEIIRESMLKYSSYENVKRNCIKRFCKNNYFRKHRISCPNFSTFDVHYLKEQPNLFEIVFSDSNTFKFFVLSETEIRSFYIHFDGIIFKPGYIRIIYDDLYVSGLICERESTSFVFLQCNLYGRIIRKTDKYLFHQREPNLLNIYGFDIDSKNEKHFLCMPNSNRIQVYNTALVECRQYYDVDNNIPEYVTLLTTQNQIWISCPKNRKILIADIDTGAFMMFQTDQINHAIPNMIFCTYDERVIFLDSRSNRFIWIKRRGDYILTQKLHFRAISEDMIINAFQVLPESLIIIGTCNEFLVFQPVKSKSRFKANLSLCNVI